MLHHANLKQNGIKHIYMCVDLQTLAVTAGEF